MAKLVSKATFKPRVLQFLRDVEKTGEELIITDRGRPVAKVVPFTQDAEELLRPLRNSVIEYRDPTAPVGLEGWEALR
jgi:prevent-host-death family protein